ncbi:restriction endonuclease subunit S [Rufibacter glacialis]|uniref:Restriction endonuclease subunit S n=1 Tax=Rufibacter glacialis TaxID=1259555 RepID=A0A5M8QF97_9BACT|nr:restriction endonuclease subunit S [Rufibacter glacialis]KAA6434707.1 restriction endonuclease subunit S [Rufibacter glacialis]GGK71773.1 type I restriction endonuclease subunit S [Rufibacter glacialis]
MSFVETPFGELYAEPSRNGIYKPKEFHGSGYKIVNMGELFGYDFIGNQDMKRVALTDAEIEKNYLSDGDLLFGRRSLVESGAGKCSLVVNPNEKLVCESSIIRVRLNKDKVEPKFYYYYFLSPKGRARIGSIVTGTNVKGIRGSELQKLNVLLPPIHTQQKIASILSAYDELIGNNLKRITLLEKSARMLYEEWFVCLRFPGNEHIRIVEGVPEGWEKKFVSELLSKNPNTKKIPKNDYLDKGKVPCVDQSSEFIGGYTDDEEAKITSPLPVIIFGDHTRVLKYINFPFARGADGTQILYPNDEKISTVFFYYALLASDISNYFYARHFKFLKAQEVLIPSKSILDAFTSFAFPKMELIKSLRDQNQKLKQARDILLPKLINGEIPV